MKTINVQLSDELYRQLKTMMIESEAYTWQDFFTKVVSHEIDVYVEIISIDGERPEGHTLEFKLGDYVYRYENGDIVMLSSPEKKKRRLALMGKTGGGL